MSHRVHSILEAPFEVHEIARFKGFTSVELEGIKDGPFRDLGNGEAAATISMDITGAKEQAMLELLQPGQRLKMYLELEHPYAHDALQIEQEPPPILYMKDFVAPPSTLSSGTALQNTGQFITVQA